MAKNKRPGWIGGFLARKAGIENDPNESMAWQRGWSDAPRYSSRQIESFRELLLSTIEEHMNDPKVLAEGEQFIRGMRVAHGIIAILDENGEEDRDR